MAHLQASLNPPCEVFFAGWRSTTYELGRAGWKISFQENAYQGLRSAPRLLLYYPASRLSAIAECEDRNFLTLEWRYQGERWDRLPRFFVHHVASDFIVRTANEFSFSAWVNTVPERTVVEDRSIYTLPLFASINQPAAEELIVEPETVSQLLDQIRAMQEPGQKDIRERNRRREREAADMPTVHARILTFPKAA